MKKPSSGVEVALWTVGGLVALYLIGGVAIWVDEVYIGQGRLVGLELNDVIVALYGPLLPFIHSIRL